MANGLSFSISFKTENCTEAFLLGQVRLILRVFGEIEIISINLLTRHTYENCRVHEIFKRIIRLH